MYVIEPGKWEVIKFSLFGMELQAVAAWHYKMNIYQRIRGVWAQVELFIYWQLAHVMKSGHNLWKGLGFCFKTKSADSQRVPSLH